MRISRIAQRQVHHASSYDESDLSSSESEMEWETEKEQEQERINWIIGLGMEMQVSVWHICMYVSDHMQNLLVWSLLCCWRLADCITFIYCSFCFGFISSTYSIAVPSVRVYLNVCLFCRLFVYIVIWLTTITATTLVIQTLR